MTAIAYPVAARRSTLRLAHSPAGRPVRPSRPPYALRRSIALVALIAIGWMSWIGLSALDRAVVGQASGAPVPVAAHTWVVQPGDTVWGIAGAISPGGDIRITVQRIVALNGTTNLEVGQRLILP